MVTEGCGTFISVQGIIQQVKLPFSLHAYRLVYRNLLTLAHNFVIIPTELRSDTARLVHKMTFDACRMPGFLNAPPDRTNLIVSGCETHVCVLKTVLGLLNAGRRVYAVRDATGSRRPRARRRRSSAWSATGLKSSLRRWFCCSRPPKTPSSQSNRSHQVIKRTVPLMRVSVRGRTEWPVSARLGRGRCRPRMTPSGQTSSFVAPASNGREAPIPDLPALTTEPGGSIESGHLRVKGGWPLPFGEDFDRGFRDRDAREPFMPTMSLRLCNSSCESAG
jgi:hypothetical protein